MCLVLSIGYYPMCTPVTFWADEAPLLQPNHLSLSEELDKLLLRWQQECWLEQSSASATATNHFFITYELWPGHLKCISELWAIRYECANSGCYWRLLLETLREATGKVSPLGLKVLRFWVCRTRLAFPRRDWWQLDLNANYSFNKTLRTGLVADSCDLKLNRLPPFGRGFQKNALWSAIYII